MLRQIAFDSQSIVLQAFGTELIIVWSANVARAQIWLGVF
jgi:hypothetical protein